MPFHHRGTGTRQLSGRCQRQPLPVPPVRRGKSQGSPGWHRHGRGHAARSCWPAARGRKAYVIPGGGSSPLGGLGYVACAQELQQQLRERQLRMDALVVGSGSSGNHGGLLAGITGLGLGTPIIGIGVSREEADQAPLGAEVGARRLRPSGPEIARACVQRSLRERVLATQIQRAQRRHGSSRANAGPHGSDPARPCLHRQGHGRIDRHGPTGHMDCRRAGALCPYRWHVFTLRL
jgi:hypothetical protein